MHENLHAKNLHENLRTDFYLTALVGFLAPGGCGHDAPGRVGWRLHRTGGWARLCETTSGDARHDREPTQLPPLRSTLAASHRPLVVDPPAAGHPHLQLRPVHPDDPHAPAGAEDSAMLKALMLALVVAFATGCAQIDKMLTPDDRERVMNAVEDARADLDATLGTVEDQARDELRRLAIERLVAP